MMKDLSICCFLMFVFCSCNSKSKQNNIIHLELADGKKADIECKFINGDTILSGQGKYYYANGNIEDLIFFYNNKKNGWHIHYDIYGKTQSRVKFENGLEEGKAFFITKRGMLK